MRRQRPVKKRDRRIRNLPMTLDKSGLSLTVFERRPAHLFWSVAACITGIPAGYTTPYSSRTIEKPAAKVRATLTTRATGCSDRYLQEAAFCETTGNKHGCAARCGTAEKPYSNVLVETFCCCPVRTRFVCKVTKMLLAVVSFLSKR